jgi:threonine dehydratase
MIPFEWIAEAADQISPYITKTPITYDHENNLYIKWENQQITGSFKARGAFNKTINLEDWERKAGLLAASAGNHGQGVALAGKKFKAPVRIYVPDEAPAVKISPIRELGAEVILIPGGYSEAEKSALREASESNATWVSPYNDGHVIAGQGTIGLEALKQLEAYPRFSLEDSTWLVPVSGGGLLAGVAASMQNLPDKPKIIGVQTEAAPFMHSLFYKGTQDNIVEAPTLADGLAGEVEPNSITIPLIKEFVDDIILINEIDILETIKYAYHRYGELIEAAAAVALSAVISGKITNKPAVVIISGGNIDTDLHELIISN